MNSKVEIAVSRFQSGSSCAQAVLSEYLPQLGVPEPLAHRMGAGLGGGIGRKQYVCGALNAGAIVLSTALGNARAADQDQKQETSARVRQFVDDFEKRFGSSQCRDLIGSDFNTEAGRQAAEAADVYRQVCDSCVKYVCQQLELTLNQLAG